MLKVLKAFIMACLTFYGFIYFMRVLILLFKLFGDMFEIILFVILAVIMLTFIFYMGEQE